MTTMGFIEQPAADDAFARLYAQGHDGATCDPTGQSMCMVPNRAIVRDNQFMPYGCWFDNATRNLVFAQNGTAVPNFRYLIFTFGDAPYSTIGT